MPSRTRRMLDLELPFSARVAGPWVFVGLVVVSAYITALSAFGFSPDAWASVTIRQFLATGSVGDWDGGRIPAWFASGFVPLVVVGVTIRFAIILSGPLVYERVLKRPFPGGFALVMVALNAFLTVGALTGIALIGLGFAAFGGSYGEGAGFLAHTSAQFAGWVQANVPTLVTVPYPWPLVLGAIPASLGYYAFHRLQHTWRPLWLLTHRIHHIPTHITLVTTTPADDPLGFFLAPVGQALLIGATTKLFALEPMMFEALAWTIVTWTIPEVFNHNEPTYRWTMGGPLRRFGFHFLGCGAYHLVHHSSAEEHRLANLAGGPFLLWDRVFGTYHAPPAECPKMGLTGRPRLWMNVFRLGLAGYLELGADLRNNRSLKERFLILLGPVSYSPPNASNYLTKPAG